MATTRPVFVYGTLRAVPLLAWVMTGDSSRARDIAPRLKRAVVHGYKRCRVAGCDYPATTKDDGSSVDGCLVTPLTASERRKIDNFEGETYKVTPVMVNLVGQDGQPTGEVVEADMYVWDGDPDCLELEASWNLHSFIQYKLQDWLDLYESMELTGGDDEDGA